LKLKFSERFRSLRLFFCIVAIGSSTANAQSLDRLISIEPGDLPIILTAPHGGSDEISGVPQRRGEGVDMFKNKSDAFTDQLTEKLADAIEQKLGKRPYVVIAHFHRKYLDANRRARDAYESPKAAPVYDAYHQAIRNARRDIVQRWGRGVLFDIHGQAAEPKVIFRGTQNGKTTTHLVNRFGHEALTGKTSVFDLLAEQSVPVIPAIGSTKREHSSYDGGYTVITHGSSTGGTIDAIQLELGRELRLPTTNQETAEKLATAITTFAKNYLPLEEQIVPPVDNVRVGVYVDEGAGRSVKNLLSVLSKFDHVTVTQLKADNIRSGKLADLDLLIQPGGSGGGQGRHLGDGGRNAIRAFVKEGGGFVGICAGSYLASADYTWSLNILDAKVVDRKHWNRGNGTVEISMTDSGRQLLEIDDQRLSIHYGQGPLLAPANRPDIDDYDVIATYETEIAKNGAPKGIMKGTTAIAKGQFGKGRVICFSPHPELTNGLEQMLRVAIDHVKRIRSAASN